MDAIAEEIDTLKISKKENIEVGKVALVEAGDGNLVDTYIHSQDGRGTTASSSKPRASTPRQHMN